MDEQLRIMGTLGFEEESERTAIEAPTDQIIHILNATPDEHRLSVMVSVLVSQCMAQDDPRNAAAYLSEKIKESVEQFYVAGHS